MNLSTPALIGLGLIGGLTVFSLTGGSGRRRPPVPPGPDGPEPGGTYTPPPAPASGDADVVYLQQVLNQLQARYSKVLDFDPLDEDGLLGDLTTEASQITLEEIWYSYEEEEQPQRDAVFADIPGIVPGPDPDAFDPLVGDARAFGDWLNSFVCEGSC